MYSWTFFSPLYLRTWERRIRVKKRNMYLCVFLENQDWNLRIMVANLSWNIWTITCSNYEISVLFSNAGVKEYSWNVLKLHTKEWRSKMVLEFLLLSFLVSTQVICVYSLSWHLLGCWESAGLYTHRSRTIFTCFYSC